MPFHYDLRETFKDGVVQEPVITGDRLMVRLESLERSDGVCLPSRAAASRWGSTCASDIISFLSPRLASHCL